MLSLTRAVLASAVRTRAFASVYVGRRQSIGAAPCCSSAAFTRLNGRDPIKPRCADNGLGCGLAITGTPPKNGKAAAASRPHNTATRGPPRAASADRAHVVTCCQPRPRCDPDAPDLTVSTRLSSSTPWSLQELRSPCGDGAMPRSVLSSRKIIDSDRGNGRTERSTAKLNPIACPGVG